MKLLNSEYLRCHPRSMQGGFKYSNKELGAYLLGFPSFCEYCVLFPCLLGCDTVSLRLRRRSAVPSREYYVTGPRAASKTWPASYLRHEPSHTTTLRTSPPPQPRDLKLQPHLTQPSYHFPRHPPSTNVHVPREQVYHEQEAELALQDRIQAETADRKNELEAYVYSLRSKLADQLSAYAPAKAREALTQRLNDMEVWLAFRVHVTDGCCFLYETG